MSLGNSYPIGEIYPTIQGEGTYTGTPALFIRLQGCPISCPWCDSRPTWDLNTEDRVDDLPIGAQMSQMDAKSRHMPWAAFSAKQLLSIALKYQAIRHIVITGGEPCIHDLQPLVVMLSENGYRVQIETSCTFPVPVGAWITASPKVDMPGGYSVLPDVVREAHELKYPVGKAAHVERLRELLTLWRIPQDLPIYLQPLSLSPKATRVCIQACLEYGFKLSVQTHKYLEID